MSVSLKESISGNQRVESADRPNNATSVNNGVFHRERLRFEVNLSEKVRAELNWFVENIHLN